MSMVADWHHKQICKETVKHPMKGLFLGGPTEEEAISVLKKKYGYTDRDIEKLKR